ncbi:MAG TPA: ATP-binding protein [Ktedonobacteraceae bacterium]
MTNQRHPVHLSIASSSEIEHTARQLKTTREEFLTTGILSQHPPRPMILESWRRCHAMQVNPSLRYAPLAVTHEDQLCHLREASQLVMRAARPVMSHLSDFLADSGYVIVLSDADGCLLEVTGDAGVRRRLAGIDFVPGGDWSEAAAGTNALGTALADGHVVQLLGAEHYCSGWQDLTCTAAPIRHPLSGEIMGILDVTGNYRLIRPFLSSFIAAMALQVQQEMRELLTPTRTGKFQAKFQTAPFSSSRGTGSRAFTMNTDRKQHRTGEDVLGTSTGDDLRSFLRMQKKRVHNAELLAAAASAMSASLDIDVTLEKIAEQTAHLLRLESTSACLFDERGEMVSLHTWSKQDGWQSEFRHGQEALFRRSKVVSLIRERGEPVIIDDVLTSVILPASLLQQRGIRSLLLLPLIAARGAIGFILAPKRIPYHWTVDDVLLGLTLAAHAATAIENARLFTTLQQHTHHVEVINDLTQLLSTLPDPSQQFEVVLRYIVERVDMDAGMILLCDQPANGLTLAAHCGLPEVVPLDLCKPSLRFLHDVARLVMTTGKSLRACNREMPIRYEPPDTVSFCDVMAVLLANDNTTLGVLLIGSLSHRKLTTEDLALLMSIGQQLGLTLTNARLRHTASEMEALREADQLKSRFVAAVSHDLQSPLTAIRASVEGLLDLGGAQSAQMHEHLLQNIAGQASRLGRLVDELLDLSRIEAGVFVFDRDWIKLPVLIADTVAKFEELHSGCQVERDLAEDLPLQYVDPVRLAQVLWNLLENALKYASSCTSIKVEARWTRNEVLIGVADHGPGIPADEREKIFQHFYRLERDQGTHTQGSGLGLAICQGIVQAHGGRIWVEDQPEGGSVFRFALPLPTASLTEPGPLEKTELFAVSTEE